MKLALLFTLWTAILFGDVIQIEGANQVLTTPSNVNAIVVDGNGNMSTQVYQYDPQQGGVNVGNQQGGENASIFFPMFMMGFLWWNGYWVGHNGDYWDHGAEVNVTRNVNWDQHWNYYWNHDWKNKWHNYYNKHKNDPNFPYRRNKNWPDYSGEKWRQKHHIQRNPSGRSYGQHRHNVRDGRFQDHPRHNFHRRH